jgi:polyisoprenoid-binding protein YceI
MTLIRPLFGAAILGIIVVAAAVAGWWFFIREDAEPKTNPQAITPELIATSTALAAADDPTAEPTSADGASGGGLAFTIVPEQSEATYLAGETLASVGLPSTAEGATQEIEGTIYLTEDGWELDPANQTKITVQLANLKTNQDRRDSRVRDALEVTQYPEATFVATRVSGVDTSISPEQEHTFQLTGLMTLHGVEKEVTWDVKATRDGEVMTALATITILYTDFDITKPDIGGFVSVEDDVTLQMDIVAVRS